MSVTDESSNLEAVKRSHLKRWLLFALVSLLLHALLFFVKPFHKPEPAPMIVELATLEKKPVRVATRVVSRARSKSADSSASRPHNFNPSFRPTSPGAPIDASLNGDISVGTRAPDDTNAPWGSGASDFSRVEDLGRFDRLYDLVDTRVVYPGILAMHQIQGTINARLVVQPNGTCDWARSKINGSQVHLKLYVLDVLKSVCAQNLVRYAHKDATNFDFSFTFAITEHNDAKLIAAQKKIVGNVFLFYRNSQQSVAEWHVGPFRGLFPVPYVILDFGWLQENYEKVIKSDDPLKDYRDHLSQDKNI